MPHTDERTEQVPHNSQVESSSADEVRALIQEANARGEEKLYIEGGGQHRKMANAQCRTLPMRALQRIIEINPEEQFVTVEPGVLLAELEAALADHQLGLGFDPVGYGYLLEPGAFPSKRNPTATIGGAIGTGIAGNLGYRFGRARDALLGFSGVTGAGEAIRSGGKVVKNVTGFDLSKLVCGSWGSIIALTELNIRVVPISPESFTSYMPCTDVRAFGTVLAGLRASGTTPSAISWVHTLADWATMSNLPMLHGVMVRFDGAGAAARAERAYAASGLTRGFEELHVATQFWRTQDEALNFRPAHFTGIWRIEATPTSAVAMVSAWHDPAAGRAGWIDQGGKIVFLGSTRADDLPTGHDAAAVDSPELVALTAHGARWRLRPCPCLPKLDGGLQRLNQRVKHSFDPRGVFVSPLG